MKAIRYITFLLLIVGGLNWGLVGAFEFDLVAYLFGELSMLSKIVYILVGLSAIIETVQYYEMLNDNNHNSYKV